MISLGRLWRDLLAKLGWRRRRVGTIEAVGRSLASDLGVPADVIRRILEQTSADLNKLAAADEASDAHPIFAKAIEEISKHGGYQCRPLEVAIMERFLDELPERELTILQNFKQGMKHREIATLMGTDVETVRRSLVKTYSDLRMAMRHLDGGGGDGNGEPIEPARSGRTRTIGSVGHER